MNILFFIFHGLSETSGISKKIRYQVEGLKRNGHQVQLCHYEVGQNGHRMWMIDNRIIKDFKTSRLAPVWKRICYRFILEYIKKENIQLVYIRSYHNANPFTIYFLRRLKKAGIHIAMEIPTYPYDQEYITPKMKMELLIDRCFRKKLGQQVDRIVTFSNENAIFGVPTINISNGIDFQAIPLKTCRNTLPGSLHLIGVAEIHYWHGYDRLIRGLADYYRHRPSISVYFHVIGNLTGPREREEILPVVHRNRLEPYVIFHGALYGEALTELFEKCDLGIGSLGRHRSGITHIKTLKNREYAARGIPFIYSETDEDFDKMPYIFKCPADESPVDIESLLHFYRSITLTPREIRNSIQHLSWEKQMQKVIEEI